MKLLYTNLTKEKATLLVYKHIGFDDELGMGIDGARFADEVLFLNENYPDLPLIEVRIISQGGRVSDGLCMCSALLNSKIPTHTINDGMAYSMAGVLLCCGSKRTAAPHSTFMMHDVGGGKDDEVMDLLTNSLAKLFESNSNLTLEKCRELMAKETWMDADQCKGMGIIDDKEPTNKTKKQITNTLAEMAGIYNRLTNEKQNKMLKLNNLLKLNADASEDSQVAAVNALQVEAGKVPTLVAENATLKAKVDAYEATDAANKKAAKDKEVADKLALVNSAVEKNLIKAEVKDLYLNENLSFETVKKMLEGLKPAYTPVLDLTNSKELQGERKDWTFSDWEKKDAAGLEKMQTENKPLFDHLVSQINTEMKSKR